MLNDSINHFFDTNQRYAAIVKGFSYYDEKFINTKDVPETILNSHNTRKLFSTFFYNVDEIVDDTMDFYKKN